MSRRQLFGLGAAACVTCCAGPLLVAVGAVASAGVLGALFLGFGAFLAAAVAILMLLAVRRHRSIHQAR